MPPPRPYVVLTGSYTFLATAGEYNYYRFTGNGTVQANVPLSVQYLAVGGGGGGASAMATGSGHAGGGGGSGGLKTNTSTLAVAGQSLPIPSLVANTTYTIVVGGGGNRGIFNSTPAGNGGSTTFTGTGINVVANGGGFGINNSGTVLGGVADAGSGAGGGFGGTSGTGQRNAGGGGGVLSAGAPGNSTTPGAGGNGLVFLSLPLGGGGGAGGFNKSGDAGSAGGTVIGGAGGVGATGGGAPAGSGTANTGSGGGGGGAYSSGAAGGSGVFILGFILPVLNDSSMQSPSFQARRPFSSSELLALRKKATEQALNAPPINAVNLQTSSEQTARVRKLASRDMDPIMEIARNGIVRREPNPVMKGGGTVPNNTSANVTARMAGNAYSVNTFNMQPQLEYQSPGCSTLLIDNITFPKQIVCAAPQSRPAYHVVQGYNQRIRFGGSKNTNKVVIAAQTNSLNTATGQCGLTKIY